MPGLALSLHETLITGVGGTIVCPETTTPTTGDTLANNNKGLNDEQVEEKTVQQGNY